MSDQNSWNHFEPDMEVRSQEGRGHAFADIVREAVTRRDVMKAGLTAALTAPFLPALAKSEISTEAAAGLNFTPVKGGLPEQVEVPDGYSSQVLMAWGDPLMEGLPKFDPATMTAEEQEKRFGYNADFVGFLPLPHGSSKSNHGLLGVNHEYINAELVYKDVKPETLTKEQVAVMRAACGFSVTEIKLDRGQWKPVVKSKLNRRITVDTPLLVSGPARGHRWMKTKSHPRGVTANGTYGNCAAGTTPWGTVLTAEENFQDVFANSSTETDTRKLRSHARYGIPKGASEYGWERHDPRFDLANEPNEPFHFGWIVEIDPYDPSWTPRKRTSMGRCRHEAATSHVTKKGQVVLYSGDDARFEYVYKFVCAKTYNREDRTANRDLLDDGVLYVAKYNADGTGEWMPLVFGQGPLTPENGFFNQGDVVIDCRIAADLLGATKMDRPEDLEVNPINEKVYLVCTNNVDRGKTGKAGPDKMNPRPENKHGHIIEMTEEGNDHAGTKFAWELFMVCGDPEDPETYFAGYPKANLAPISCPDNVAFDLDGNLWIATDGMPKAIKEHHDGFYAVPVSGPERGHLKRFMTSVPGAEVCGPCFTPDNKTVFLAIQHPAEGSVVGKLSTNWPGTHDVPRPAVVAIRHKKGQRIGR